jgi:hypothetical protein
LESVISRERKQERKKKLATLKRKKEREKKTDVKKDSR